MGADRLRPSWDFADLDASERRFRALLEEESPVGRAEVLTQLARVQGLRGSYGAADELLDEAEALAGSTPVVAIRVALERGRVRRSSGEVAESLPLFEAAYADALDEGAWFIAADAAHMAAIAAPGLDEMLAWTDRGVDLAEAHESARYWLGSLLNNAGWSLHEAGEHERALDAFSRALAARQEAGDELTVQVARHAVGVALRALGRPAEAAAELEQAVAWADGRSSAHVRLASDLVDVRGMFHEELAEDYAALGRGDAAREHARIALELLDGDPSFAHEESRAARLRALAGAS